MCAVAGLIEQVGGSINHVKFHGALYNYSAQNEIVCDSAMKLLSQILPGIKVYGLHKTYHETYAEQYNLRFISEGFGDRAYQTSKKLVPRSHKGAIIDDPENVARQVGGFLHDSSVKCMNGSIEPMYVDTICIHGDHKRIDEVLPLLSETFR